VTERALPRPPEHLSRSAGLKPRLHSRPRDLPVGREAVTLPLLLLTVAGAGGLRVDAAGKLALVPPSLMALVLGVLLIATLVRAGALDPLRLVGERRSALENTSGAIVLASLLLASAQMFMLLTPPTGLLGFIFTVFFVLLLWNTMAVSPDRRQLLRSLAVVFGGAFVLKFIVLAAAYDAGGGLLHRVILTMLEGVSLGALGFVPDGTATGYVAFLLLGLFFVGLILLPGRQARRPD
jgi:hypothetical protein